ncbi:MAG: hypothetical protein HQM01_08105 [Magnetococcales bacterium]|nr:hypothetical protein [Magnetococcales bacterium]
MKKESFHAAAINMQPVVSRLIDLEIQCFEAYQHIRRMRLFVEEMGGGQPNHQGVVGPSGPRCNCMAGEKENPKANEPSPSEPDEQSQTDPEEGGRMQEEPCAGMQRGHELAFIGHLLAIINQPPIR